MRDDNNVELPQVKSDEVNNETNYQSGGQINIQINKPVENNYQYSKQIDIPIINNNSVNTYYNEPVNPQQTYAVNDNTQQSYTAYQVKPQLTDQEYGAPHVNYNKEVKSLVETEGDMIDVRSLNKTQRQSLLFGLIAAVIGLLFGFYMLFYGINTGSITQKNKYIMDDSYLAFYEKNICSFSGDADIKCDYKVNGTRISVTYQVKGSEFSKVLKGVIKSDEKIVFTDEVHMSGSEEVNTIEVDYTYTLTDEVEPDELKPEGVFIATTTTTATTTTGIQGSLSGYVVYDDMMKENVKKNATITNYSMHTCPTAYYSNKFYIEDNTLYASIDPTNSYTDHIMDSEVKVMDNVGRVFSVKVHNCGLEYLFVSALDGSFYYINNLTVSSNEMFQPSVVNIRNVVDITSLDINGNYAIEYIDFTGGSFYGAEFDIGVNEAE